MVWSVRTLCAVAVVLLTFCVCCIQGGNVNVLFAELDAQGPESDLAVTAPVRVSGSLDGNITVMAIPLTVTSYTARAETYENSCDSLVSSSSLDQAEDEDFNAAPIEQIIAPDTSTNLHEFDISIPLIDDTVREAEEYFLLWINASTSDPRDSISYTSARRCIIVSITADADAISLNFIPLLTEVNENAGTVDVLKVVKSGETEIPIEITFSAFTTVFTVSPTSVTLQPDDNVTIVNITVQDDRTPEDDIFVIINAQASQFGSDTIQIKIKDDDEAVIGFEQTEVTVIEGETITLETSFKNNLTVVDFMRSGLFRVFTQRGKGNASVPEHYSMIERESYFPGDPIEITTVDDEKLERPRQFEVRIVDPMTNPLNVLNPNHVTVTIRDNDGTPNVPTVTDITFSETTKTDISVSWIIDMHELRPVHKYYIIFEITESKNDADSKSGDENNQNGDGDNTPGGDDVDRTTEKRQFNVTAEVTEVKCELDNTGHKCNHVLTMDQEPVPGSTYSVTVCAQNEFGIACGDPIANSPTPLPLIPAARTPNNNVVWIVIGVVVAVLLCCLLWVLVAVVCCCLLGGGREKKYSPERKERENEEQLEKYRKVKGSESPDIPDEYDIDV